MKTLLTDDPPQGDLTFATLVPIALEAMGETAALDFDLYLCANEKSSPVLYRERTLPLTRRDIDQLVAADIRTVYVSLSDHLHVRRYMQEKVDGNQHVSAVHRYRTLKQLNQTVFDSVAGGSELNGVVQLADMHSAHLASVISDRDLVLDDLFSLMDHDYYTYTHAANVSTYSVMLARGLGIADQVSLAAIGAGGVLHDIGKRRIPPYILNKPGRLETDEWDIVQQHPRTGFDDLAPREDVNWGQLMMIYQHHERLDGSGYPVGLEGDEIHEWARICAIADVYDALTSDRPYRKRDPAGKTLEFLQQNAGKGFDKEMVKCWTEIMKSHHSLTV